MKHTAWYFALVLASLSGCIIVADDPPPPADMYEPCATTSECVARADACYILSVSLPSGRATDGICSSSCTSDAECPYSGACYELEGNPAICYSRCVDDYDCPVGFGCIDTIGGQPFDAICLPAP